MEKKQKLILMGVVLCIIVAIVVWINLPAGSNVDSKTAEDARAAATQAQAKEDATPAPPPPPPPPGATSKGAVPHK